jgi:hypothetical protein
MTLRGRANAISVDVSARRREAVKLAREGESWDDIADTLKYASRGAAFTDVERAMKAGLAEMFVETELYRYESLERLRELLKALWPRRADEKVAGEIRRIISDMNDLTGAKAPMKFEIGEGDLDRLLRDSEAEIGRRTAAAQVEASRRASGETPPG